MRPRTADSQPVAGGKFETLVKLIHEQPGKETTMKKIILAVIAASGLVLAASAAQAETKTFPKPKAGPYRIDWCLNWAAQCGQPAADKFCQSMGYVNSTDFDQAPKLNLLVPPVATIVQNSGQVCSAAGGMPQCDGFAQITCTRPDLPAPPPPPAPPPGPGAGGGPDTIYKSFINPKYHGKRLAYCDSPGGPCGQDPADSYCDLKGFDDAANYIPSPPLPPGKTRFIGTEQICLGPICKSFSKIICEREP
jgi:hypothetical protein